MSDSAKSFKLTLEKPAVLEVEIPLDDNYFQATLDLFVAYQEVIDADKEPDEISKWNRLRKYLVRHLSCDEKLITISVAYEFRELVIAASKEVMDVVKKKSAKMRSSQLPIPESPETTGNGPS